MRLLLDTRIALGLVDGSLPGGARETISAAAIVFVSAASIWEMVIKCATGRLRVDLGELLSELQRLGVERLEITSAHALAVRNLPPFHPDPFDRMLVAQAQVEPLHLVTHDRTLQRYSALIMAV